MAKHLRRVLLRKHRLTIVAGDRIKRKMDGETVLEEDPKVTSAFRIEFDREEQVKPPSRRWTLDTPRPQKGSRVGKGENDVEMVDEKGLPSTKRAEEDVSPLYKSIGRLQPPNEKEQLSNTAFEQLGKNNDTTQSASFASSPQEAVLLIIQAPFRENRKWWESVLLARKLILISLYTAINSLNSGGMTFVRGVVLTSVSALVLAMHVILEPYSEKRAQLSETVFLFVLVLLGALRLRTNVEVGMRMPVICSCFCVLFCLLACLLINLFACLIDCMFTYLFDCLIDCLFTYLFDRFVCLIDCF